MRERESSTGQRQIDPKKWINKKELKKIYLDCIRENWRSGVVHGKFNEKKEHDNHTNILGLNVEMKKLYLGGFGKGEKKTKEKRKSRKRKDKRERGGRKIKCAKYWWKTQFEGKT